MCAAIAFGDELSRSVSDDKFELKSVFRKDVFPIPDSPTVIILNTKGSFLIFRATCIGISEIPRGCFSFIFIGSGKRHKLLASSNFKDIASVQGRVINLFTGVR